MVDSLPSYTELPEALPQSPAGRLTRGLYWYFQMVYNSELRGSAQTQDIMQSMILPLAFFVRAADQNLPLGEGGLDTGLSAGAGHPAMVCAARLMSGFALICADQDHLPNRDQLLYQAQDFAPLMNSGLGEWLRQNTLEAEWQQLAVQILGFIDSESN